MPVQMQYVPVQYVPVQPVAVQQAPVQQAVVQPQAQGGAAGAPSAVAGGGAVAAAGGVAQIGTAPDAIPAALQGVVTALTQLVQTLQGMLASQVSQAPPSSGCPHMQGSADAKQGASAATQGGGAAGAPSAPPAAGTSGSSSARQGVLLIGDSLTVGVKKYFTDALAGQPVEVDATGGIPLKEGMRRYNARKDKPRVVEMALFTNNSSKQINELRSSIQQTINDARARGGRVVWATIVRPGDYGAVNQMIREMAARNRDVMGLVDWRAMIDQHPEWLTKDGVHANAAGYRARAQAFADAARS